MIVYLNTCHYSYKHVSVRSQRAGVSSCQSVVTKQAHTRTGTTICTSFFGTTEATALLFGILQLNCVRRALLLHVHTHATLPARHRLHTHMLSTGRSWASWNLCCLRCCYASTHTHTIGHTREKSKQIENSYFCISPHRQTNSQIYLT